MGGRAAILVLLEKLLDEDKDICQAAGRMLRDMVEEGDALAFGFFLSLLITMDDEDPASRETAARIIVQLWSMSEERELIVNQREKLYTELAAAYEDPSFEEKTLTLLESDQPFLVPAIWSLGIIGNHAHASRVAQLLDHKDGSVRWISAWVLGEIEDPISRTALLRSLNIEEKAEVLQTIVRSVGKLKINEAAEPLVDILNTATNLSLRREAIQSLKAIGAIKAADALLRSLDDDEDEIRVIAAEALGRSARNKPFRH